MATDGDPAGEVPLALLAALRADGPLGRVGEGFRELVAAWSGAGSSPMAHATTADAATAPASGVDAFSDDQLLAALRAIGQVERSLEALKVACSSEVARRSRGSSRHEGLAGRQGFPTPERLIAATTGASTGAATRLVAVASATTAPESFGGASAAPRYPQVAAAISSGAVSVELAHRITSFLDSVRLAADPERLREVEGVLLERGQAVGVDGIGRYLKLLRAQLDGAGVRQREDELHAQRSLRMWEDGRGMIQLRGCFDPASAAPLKAAVDSLVSADLHAARDARSRVAAGVADGVRPAVEAVTSVASPDAADRALVDGRSIEQMTADALVDIARLAISAADAPPALASAVVVVRVDHDALTDDAAFATIDDVEQPVSTATARGYAASAGIIPMHVTSDGEVLHLGRRRRLFTKAQRIALAERDGGCAHPDCARPVSHTHAHHIRWWDAHDGPTDLDNGVLLCAFHHWMIHHDGWQVFLRDGQIWFVPPPHLDPEQRPRPGRRATRLELQAA